MIKLVIFITIYLSNQLLCGRKKVFQRKLYKVEFVLKTIFYSNSTFIFLKITFSLKTLGITNEKAEVHNQSWRN